MRKNLLHICFCLLTLFFFAPAGLQAQCTVAINPAQDTICAGDTVTLTASVPAPGLLTTMAAGNSHRGNMFDLVALNTVTITSFEGSPMGTTGISIYYKVGTHVGFENNSAAWTLVGTASNVVPIGSPTPTPFPIAVNVTIPAGQTYAFYVTSSNTAVSLNYTDGTARGNVYAQDANLQFLEGSGLEYPFTGGTSSVFQPRIWNGRINYATATGASFAWNTGATTSSITVTPSASTSYTVTATSGGTCIATATVEVNNFSLSLGLDSSYCSNSSILLDASSGSNQLWHTGATSATITGTPGINWVEATDANGCAGRDSVNLTENIAPVVNLGSDTVGCGGNPLVLDAGNAGGSYSWSTGGGGQTETVSASGTYSVAVTDGNGCSDADTIVVAFSTPSVSLGADTALCGGASITLDAGSATQYDWSTGALSQTISASAPGSYSVTITDSLGCNASDNINLALLPSPTAAFSISGNSGCDQATVTNTSTSATSALWIWGDGSQDTVLNPGSHTYPAPYVGDVTLIVSNDCGSDTLVLPFGCVGISDANAIGVSISPNPTQGKINVQLDGLSLGNMRMSIFDLQGREMRRHEVEVQASQYNTELSLEGMAQGLYLLRIESQGQSLTRRVVLE